MLTDKIGFQPVSETPNKKRGEDPRATSDSLTWLDLRGSQINFGDADVSGRPYLRNGLEAFLYTDRGVYRPGETVHLRAIVRGRDNVTPPMFPVKWRLRRPDLRDWKSQIVQLDPDGSAGLEIELPADLSTGRWTADIGLPGEKEAQTPSFGTLTFQVEEFVPNRMKVVLDVAGGKGKPGDDNRLSLLDGPLVASVQADYLFGRPVTERPATLIARSEPASFSPKQWANWTFGDTASTAEVLGGKRATGGRAELPEASLDARGRAQWKLDTNALFDAAKRQHNARLSELFYAEKRGGPRVTEEVIASQTPTEAAAYAGPWRVTLAASVIETGGRAVSAGRSVDVDCVPYYLALRLPGAAAIPRQPYAVELALVAPSGEIEAGATKLEVGFYRETWNNSLVKTNGRYHYESTRRLELVNGVQFATIKAGRGMFQVTPPAGGSYVLRVRDPETGVITSRGFMASEGAWEDNISRADPEKLELVVLPVPRVDFMAAWAATRRCDGGALIAQARETFCLVPAKGVAREGAKFRVGDDAQVIVRSPFAGQLLLTVETDSIVSTRVITMPASHVSVPVRITGACRPNAYVAATVIRAIDADAKWATHRAFGVARLNVDNSDRRLRIEVAAPAEVRPSRSLGIDVRLTDDAGHPAANAAVTVAAVDEGICALTNFSTPDPFSFFTSRRALGVKFADFYSQLMPEVARPDKQSAVGGDGASDDDARNASPVSARRVRPVSLFAGVLHTDANGIAHADFNVPEFSGQLRIMTVGYGAKSFGSAAKAVLVRSPLLVQSSWPRFAAPGDAFSVPLIVFNNGKTPGTVQVTVDLLDENAAPSPLALRGTFARSLTLPPMAIKPGGQAQVAFDAIASQSAGVARARVHATMNGETFEEHIELPVRPASPTMSTGGYAVATPDAPGKLTVPGGMLEGTGEFQIQISPKPVLELPRGLEYLEHYPYGCAEQTASSCFPLVYLSDIGKEIAPGVFEQQRVADKVNAGILRLVGMQTSSGGLSMWPGERNPWPWGSVYAAHFLVEARAAGFDVPQEFYDSLLAYVRNELNYSGDEADAIEGHCYACYVLALAGKPERAVMSHLAELLSAPPPSYPRNGWRPYSVEARFDLAAAWLAAGRRDLALTLIPHTLPLPRRDRTLSGNVGSPIRDRAVLVNTLLAVQPDHPELAGLVQQLSDAGRNGQWRSTQDMAFSVMALGRYLRQTKAEKPFDAAELLLGETRIAQTDAGKPLTWFASSRQGSPAAPPRDGVVQPTLSVPLPAGGSELAVRITGAPGSKAHIAWLCSGVPLQPPADADSGMKIRRRYLDSHGKPLIGDAVRSGDLVQVELTVQADTSLDNIVIDDLLPAGLEIENSHLETTAGADAVERTRKPGEASFDESRRDVRDDRLVLMGRLSSAGSGTYVYTARAVTPGTFIIPPVRAECMYDIGTSSLSGGGKMLKVVPIEKASMANTAE